MKVEFPKTKNWKIEPHNGTILSKISWNTCGLKEYWNVTLREKTERKSGRCKTYIGNTMIDREGDWVKKGYGKLKRRTPEGKVPKMKKKEIIYAINFLVSIERQTFFVDY